MKRLELTPELAALIKERVGEDVDLEGVAVFEAVTLNTKPLPGKVGSFWEGAVATALTLRQIADHITAGGHIPLVFGHDMSGVPKGRVFDAGLSYDGGGEFELRTLFYLDKTEGDLASMIDSGSLDEVSISFLPTSYLCSECGFDFLGEEATRENFWTRTCGEGHEIGTNGTHVRMAGLKSLMEVSLVARGAADNPKIVGRSASKLAPAHAPRLAARGFEIDDLVCQASRGEYTVDTTKLIADLTAATSRVAVLEAAEQRHATELSAANTTRDEAVVARDEALGRVAELQTQLEAAQAENKTEERDAAVEYLTSVLTKLRTAAGEEAENLPTTVAELTAAIDAKTKGLTALIPAGGASEAGGEPPKEDRTVSLSAFKTRR